MEISINSQNLELLDSKKLSSIVSFCSMYRKHSNVSNTVKLRSPSLERICKVPFGTLMYTCNEKITSSEHIFNLLIEYGVNKIKVYK